MSEVDKRSLDFGSDADGDEKNEVIESYVSSHTPVGYESISTPAGTFRCLKVVESGTIVIKSTSTAVRVTSNITDTFWLAPGISLIRENLDVDSSGSNGFKSVTTETGLQRTAVKDVVYPGAARHKSLALTNNDVVYDASRDRIYVSVPSSVGWTGNSVAIIDPKTGSILQSIPVRSGPNALGLSKDSKFLYVGLDGSGQVSKLNLATLQVDQVFSLGIESSGTVKYARRIEVFNGSPNSIAVGWGDQVKTSLRGLNIFDGSSKRTQGFRRLSNDVFQFDRFRPCS